MSLTTSLVGGRKVTRPPSSPKNRLIITKLCHERDVLVSTGDFLEQVLMQGKDAVKSYIRECKELGFDIIEISSGLPIRKFSPGTSRIGDPK